MDHELDLVANFNLSWSFKDAEVMEPYIEQGRFTRSEVEQIEAEGSRIGQMLDSGQQWWDTTWETWNPPVGMSDLLVLPPRWAD